MTPNRTMLLVIGLFIGWFLLPLLKKKGTTTPGTGTGIDATILSQCQIDLANAKRVGDSKLSQCEARQRQERDRRLSCDNKLDAVIQENKISYQQKISLINQLNAERAGRIKDRQLCTQYVQSLYSQPTTVIPSPLPPPPTTTVLTGLPDHYDHEDEMFLC